VTVLCQGEELYHATVVPDPAGVVRSEIPASKFQQEQRFTVVDLLLLPDHGVAAVGVLRPRLTEDGWHFV
jgi:hypothetical protein